MVQGNAPPSPQSNDQAAALDGLARHMVNAIDSIIGHLTSAMPTEGGVPLTFHEVQAAKAIVAGKSITMSGLASALRVSLPTATHLVDRLVAKGVAVRTRPEHDRRLVLVALSEEAEARERAFFDFRVANSRNILETIGPVERERAVKALGELALVVQAHAASQAEHTNPK